jgi:DNA-binding response OmpR family regulator
MAARILVVDDATSIVTLVKATLEAKGYTIDVAYNGSEGLALAKLHKPDLIILDMMMPRMDGTVVRKRLGADPDTKDIPVIHLTAVGDFDTQRDALADGAIDYIVKPFTPSDLADRVAAVLDPSKREKTKSQHDQKAAQMRTITDIMHRSSE